MMYRNEKELEAVIGSLENNEFLNNLEKDTKIFVEEISHIFKGLAEKK